MKRYSFKFAHSIRVKSDQACITGLGGKITCTEVCNPAWPSMLQVSMTEMGAGFVAKQ